MRPGLRVLPVAIAMLGTFAAAVASAQGLGEGWTVLGEYTVMIGKDTKSLYAVEDSESGNRTMSDDDYGGFRVLQITGVAPGPEGNPGVPILTVTIGPWSGETPDEVAIEYREADRVLMANIDSESEPVLSEFALENDGTLTFAFEGDLAVMTPTSDGAFEPVPGAVSTMISGTFTGILPQE